MKEENLVSLADYSSSDIWEILELTKKLKSELRSGRGHFVLPEKTLGMVFLKPSLRTRVSFEVGMTQMGGHAVYLGPDDIKLGQRETTEDIALVLSRYVDAIMARVFGHGTIKDLARYATVPVVNGLSDLLHPCQALADIFTIYERKRHLEGLRLAFIGDGNNVAHSLINACSLMGLDFSIACPRGYEPEKDIVSSAENSGTKIEVSHDPPEVASGADVLYTDVWASMGEEDIAEQKKGSFEGFRINQDLLERADKEAIVMHCLPAHYDEEISKEVAHGPQSVIFEQAENRLHAQKALLNLLIGK